MFTSAFAQTATGLGGPGGDFLGPLIPFVLIAVVFYFLLIRPQQKRLKDHKSMIEAVRKGDTVVTSGGLIGKVLKVDEDEVQVDLGDGVKVRVVRSTLADVRTRGELVKAANDKGAAEKPAKRKAANTDKPKAEPEADATASSDTEKP